MKPKQPKQPKPPKRPPGGGPPRPTFHYHGPAPNNLAPPDIHEWPVLWPLTDEDRRMPFGRPPAPPGDAPPPAAPPG